MLMIKVSDFIEYLSISGNKKKNTLVAYERDLNEFELFLKERDGKPLNDCSESDAVAFVLALNKKKKSKATINRKISSIRMFYEYLIDKDILDTNPFSKIKSTRNDRRDIDFLSVETVEKLLSLPEDTDKGIRDRALMEFMYGTGARVTEVVRLKFSDINFKMSFVTLRDSYDEKRIVPLGSYANAAMRRYINEAYISIKGREVSFDDYFFINLRGEALTRQGIWKIFKEYGEMIGIAERMTPQIFRDSFATHILQNGGDLKTLQELMGFEDMSVGIAYLAMVTVHVKEVFNKCHPRA